MVFPSTKVHSGMQCLPYGWTPTNLPTYCVCGKKLKTEHAFSSPRGGYPSIRHNEICDPTALALLVEDIHPFKICDLTAMLLSEVCHNVGIEPHL